MKATAASVAPSGWLLCYGQAISRTTYANLFSAISTTYGPGNGTTTFNVPDLRGRAVAGRDDMGGAAAGRLTNSGTGNPGINGSALGAAGGVDRYTLTTTQLAIHAHGVTQAPHSHGVTDPQHSHGLTDPQHDHIYSITEDATLAGVSGSPAAISTGATATTTASPTNISINNALTGISINGASADLSINYEGAGEAHPNTQPTIVLNYVIFTGV